MGWLFRKPHPPPKPQVPPPPPKPQTHVLGVNLQCCEACPYKIKKKLLKLKGVTAVHIDVNKGLVSVTGIVAPSVLLNVVKKVNKTGAKLVSSTEVEDKKNEEEAKKKEEEKKKKEEIDKCSYKIGEKPSSDKESQQPPKDGIKCQGDFYMGSSSCNGGPVQHWMPYPPPVQHNYPPMPPYYGGGPPPMPCSFPPPQPMQNQPQPIKINPPPAAYPDDFYKRKVNLQAENNMFQQFRDDNVDSCNIM